jgi:hypothetical protein
VRAISFGSKRELQSLPLLQTRRARPTYHADDREANAARPKPSVFYSSAKRPTYCVAWELIRLIEITQPNVDLFLGFLFRDAIFLLDLANETVEFTGDSVNVIFR